MKRIILFASILVLGLSGAMVSCYFEAAQDNPNDPKSGLVPPSDIYMFNAGQYNGDLDGRTGVEAKCFAARKAKGSSLPAQHVHGFISIASGDAIADMPVNYKVPTDRPIVGPGGNVIIANNWTDLLNGTIDYSLEYAGVLTVSTDWWSGSNSSGAFDPSYSCNNWESDAATGTFGQSGAINANWIYYSSAPAACSSSKYLLCISWN